MTTDTPLISVCMPVYNAGKYLADAVESILGQTFADFEFLILDDGSTDDSLEILRRYADRDPRIRLTSRPNKGLVASLNELIDQSRGEFIARMDGDDISLPERFQKQVDYLRAHPGCLLVGSRVRLIDPEGDPLCDWCTLQDHEAIDASYLRGQRDTLVSHPVIMMRRDAVLAIGKYRPFEVIEDVRPVPAPLRTRADHQYPRDPPQVPHPREQHLEGPLVSRDDQPGVRADRQGRAATAESARTAAAANAPPDRDVSQGRA